jgi:hypothetical protein
MDASPLNYRPSHSAVYYTPPRRIDIARTVVGFIAGTMAAMAGAFIYAKLQRQLHSPILRIGEMVGGALAVGIIASSVVAYGRVRLPLVAVSIGAVLGMIALYAMWVTWVHDVFNRPRLSIAYWSLISHPMYSIRIVRFVGTFGTWKYHGEVIRGPALWVIWILEATPMLLCGALFPLKAMPNDDPVCLWCGSTCRLVRPIARFAIEGRDELIAQVEGRRFAAIATYPPPPDDSAPQLSVRLMSCPRCGQTNVVTINNICWTRDRNGARKLDIRPLVNQLMITSAEAVDLKQVFKQMTELREATEPPPFAPLEPPS